EGRLRPVQVSGREDEAGAEPDAVRVGSHLAALWGLRAGDAVEIASSRPTLTPFGPQPRVRRLRVAAPLPVGRSEEEDRVEGSLEAAEALFGGAGRRLEIKVEDRRLAAVQAAVAARAPGAPQANWRDLHRGLLFALRLEKTVLFVAISLIALVASLALVADLS